LELYACRSGPSPPRPQGFFPGRAGALGLEPTRPARPTEPGLTHTLLVEHRPLCPTQSQHPFPRPHSPALLSPLCDGGLQRRGPTLRCASAASAANRGKAAAARGCPALPKAGLPPAQPGAAPAWLATPIPCAGGLWPLAQNVVTVGLPKPSHHLAKPCWCCILLSPYPPCPPAKP